MIYVAGCLSVGLAVAANLCGQSLLVAPSETDRKTPGTFTVVIDSPQGRAPVALQWEFSIPPAIAIKIADITIGKAAKSSQKTLICAASAKQPAKSEGAKFRCILAGGRTPIANGPIAQVQYRAQVDVEGAPIRVTIENVVGASADLKQIPISNLNAIIQIR